MTTGHARRILPAMIAVAAATLFGAEFSHGQALSSGETARLLARVEAIDGKCSYLGPADHDVLRTFVARAEVAAAGEGGPQGASEAVASGRAEGASAACNDQSARLVRSAYASARSAASGTRRGQAAAAPPSRQMAPPQRNRQMEAWPEPQPGPGSGGAISRYGRRLEAYYINLRCRHLTRPDSVRFWQSIIQDQRNAAREGGSYAVAAVQQRARMVASRGWCGSNTVRRVIDGYRGVLAR